MKTITNLQEAQALFPDAIQLRLRLDKPHTPHMVRMLIPDSVTIVFCKISKNYASVIYSKGAKENCYPDVTGCDREVKSLDGLFALRIMTYVGQNEVNIFSSFCPSAYPDFIQSLSACELGRLTACSNDIESGTGSLTFELFDWRMCRDVFFDYVQTLLNCDICGHEPQSLIHTGTK